MAAVGYQFDPVAARQPLAEGLAREIAAGLALELRTGPCTEPESDLAVRLQRERYEAQSFLRTR